MKRVTYYELGFRKFSLEVINPTFCELMLWEDDKFFGSWVFEGATACSEALAEILSYAEIDEDEFNADAE